MTQTIGEQERRLHFIWNSQNKTFQEIDLYKNRKISFVDEMNSVVQFTNGLRPQNLFLFGEASTMSVTNAYFQPDIYHVETNSFEPVAVEKRHTDSYIDITKQGSHILEFQNNLRQEYRISYYAENVSKVTFNTCKIRPHCYCPAITFAFLLLEATPWCDDDLLCLVIDMLV